MESPLSFRSYPRAIVHIDGDAFFASCEIARDPSLRGKPVVTGAERGIASAMSYEAKRLGVTRGMPLHEIRKVCPQAIIIPSDYETYSLYAARMYAIVRRFTPLVEEYSIDECFAEITGLRRPLHRSYEAIARDIKTELDRELGITFSVGLAPTKVLAKVGSKWQKPDGFTMIPGNRAHEFLATLPVGNVWGIGAQTTAFLHAHHITTALQFAHMEEGWIDRHCAKPYREIWQELRGESVLPLSLLPQPPKSISKTKTFTPPSSDRARVYAELAKNVENACIKARRHSLSAKRLVIFLKRQDFRYIGIEVELAGATNSPEEILAAIEGHFDRLFIPQMLYRATGAVLSDLSDDAHVQPDLFGAYAKSLSWRTLHTAADAIDRRYGKHTVFLAATLPALRRAPHASREDGGLSGRAGTLFQGEPKRKHLGIAYLGEVG